MYHNIIQNNKQNNVSTLLKETNYAYLCVYAKFEWTKIYIMHVICKKIFKVYYAIMIYLKNETS